MVFSTFSSKMRGTQPQSPVSRGAQRDQVTPETLRPALDLTQGSGAQIPPVLFALPCRRQVLCSSTVRSRVLNRPGGGSSLSRRDQSYLCIYILGDGGRARGEPTGWPCLAEIKRLSLGLGKNLASLGACVCAGTPGEGLGVEAGRGRRSPSQSNPGVVFYLAWDPRDSEARGTPDGATSTGDAVTR